MANIYAIERLISRFKRRCILAVKGDRSGVGLFYFKSPNTLICSSIDELLEEIFRGGEEIKKLIHEGNLKYEETIEKCIVNFPTNWNGERNLSILLYVLVRQMNAKVVVETGVANGISTNMIMAALEKNEGKLISFDIDPMSRKSYNGSGKWEFNLLNKRNPEHQLLKAIQNLEKIDLWLHDSDHSHWWQTFEYKLAFSKLKVGGYLVADDVDFSTAWAEFSPNHFSRDMILFDFKKLVGCARK